MLSIGITGLESNGVLVFCERGIPIAGLRVSLAEVHIRISEIGSQGNRLSMFLHCFGNFAPPGFSPNSSQSSMCVIVVIGCQLRACGWVKARVIPEKLKP